MNANVEFTIADSQRGYCNTRQALREQDTEQLLKEYADGMLPCFNNMFGRNARTMQNLVADALLERGVTELPNIFGPIQIKNDW